MEQVGALLAQRGERRPGAPQFNPATKPTYTQVQDIIDLVASDIDAEADGAALASGALRSLITSMVAFAAAATVELTFYPEQESNGAGAILWSRYQQGLIRFQTLLAVEGGGPPTVGTIAVASPTRAAAQRLVAGLPSPYVPVVISGGYPYGWDESGW